MPHDMNEQAISTDLLTKVFDLYTQMSPDDIEDFEIRFFCLCEFLQEIGLENEPQSFALIIDRRLAALAKFVVNEGGEGSTDAGAGMTYGRADLIHCAAIEPLIDSEDGEAEFDRGSFHRCLRTTTKARSRGRSGNE